MKTRPTILVCDDDPLLVELIQLRLMARGYRVIVATDGVEAVAQAELLRPQAIVLDSMMPRADGLEVLHRLRKNANLRGTPVIMLSARRAESDIVTALERGADDYIVKPFIPDELIARLARLVGPRHAARL